MYTRSAALQRPGARLVEVVLPLVDTRMTAGRGTRKLSPAEAAEQIHQGITRGDAVVRVGQTRLLPLLLRTAPGLLTRLMNRVDAPAPATALPARGVAR
jgi:hypothetical protein